ncbi:type II secretion system minor pseudopilin GspJ [Vibrio sp. SCSIO 43136]|uniref:type II secretion system minor pseudopilin GspJ n=1 Tax=Vibrio sp. SCSIO 43136 TaxID=2819101 RepID=UPI00207579CF|nr:type II secretion system minor pseudopilin GspJ [Vibrio sp. SCSIO 43136]USD65183.1 type II secretion system minor pseudopilin GspJ [Vibrio sp. SCSIO 43136]
MSRRSQGFTLIEVLVSIAIFASLSVAAYQVVSQIQRSNEVSQEKTQRIEQLQRSLVFMDNDFRQMTLRQWRDDGEELSTKLLRYEDYLLDSDEKGVLFARGGWQNPQQVFPRSEVTKVGYRVRENKLERVWWRYPDTQSGEPPLVRVMLDNVESMTLKFYDGQSWKSAWDKDKALPKAVELTLKLKDYGELTRVYLTPGSELNASQESDG